jgi:hypothetical protein
MPQHQFPIPTYGFLRLPQVLAIITPEEHAQISESAARAGISLSTFAKRICIDFLRMEQIAAEARAKGCSIGDIKRRIDDKAWSSSPWIAAALSATPARRFFFRTRPQGERSCRTVR